MINAIAGITLIFAGYYMQKKDMKYWLVWYLIATVVGPFYFGTGCAAIYLGYM